MATVKSINMKLYILIAAMFIFSTCVFAQDDLEKGITAVKAGDYVSALSFLKNAPKDKYEASLYYGIALYKTGSPADAEKSLKAAIKNDDERPEAYAVLGEIYTDQKKFDLAESEFSMAKKYLPLDKSKDMLNAEEINQVVSVLSKEAESYIASGKNEDVDNAIRSLTQAKTYNDKDPLIYVGLGDAYFARGSYELAASNYQQALKIKSYAPAYYGLGMIDFKQKKYNDALDNFSKSTDADNNFAPSFFEKGLLYYLGDKTDLALDAFKRYSELVPGSLRGNTYYAKTLYKKGDYDGSIKLLDDALKIDQNYSEANKYMGYDYAAKKDFDKADSYFGKVPESELNAEDYDVWGKMYSDEKNYAKAYPLFDKSIAADSTDPDVYFEYAKGLFSEQKYPEAQTKFAKSIDLGITNVAAYVYEGICYFYLEQYDKGIEILDKSIALNSTISSAYLWKANCFAAAKKNPEACEMYKKYLTMQPDDQFAKDQIDKLCK